MKIPFSISFINLNTKKHENFSIHKNWEGREGGTSSRYNNPEIIGWIDNYPTLIVEQNVDLVLNGHVHHYERTWPMKNTTTWEER